MKMHRKDSEKQRKAMGSRTIPALSMLVILFLGLTLMLFTLPGTARAVSALDGFDPNADFSVTSVALQPDGKIIIGGDFTAVGGVARNHIARLTNTDVALQELSLSSASTITWMRVQVSLEVWRTTFEHSTDGTAWTYLGSGTRISGGWQLTGLSFPYNQNFYIRARGYATGGYCNASGSLIESVRLFYQSFVPLYATFTGYGLYKHDGTSWTQLNGTIPNTMIASGNTVYATFTG